MEHTVSVFTKPWPDDSIDRIADRVAGMGFQGVELADPAIVAAVWDSGHAAVCGEDPAHGMAVCGEHLALADFKNYRYESNPDG